MIIHKLHIQDWKHLLSSLSQDLFRMSGENYEYIITDAHKLREIIRKIESIITYLRKINKHVLEEGSILTDIKKKILEIEPEENPYNKERINRDKNFYKEEVGNLLRLIQTIENHFEELKNNLESIEEEMSGEISHQVIATSRKLTEKIESELSTIEGLSTSMAKVLSERYKQIAKEMNLLKEQDNMIIHLKHNVESWFLH